MNLEKKFDENIYKQKYNKEHYMRIPFNLKKDDAIKFKENLKKENIRVSDFFNICVKNYEEILKKFTN